MKKFIAMLAVVAVALLGIVLPAYGTADGGDEPCVPQEAWSETIEHPEVTEEAFHEAVTETIRHEAVTETVEGVWANFSPNDNKGLFDGPPTWPSDPRGTWNIHGQLPPGQAGPDGVYQQGSGNSSWFYRQAEKVTLIEEAYDEVVVVEEAWTEIVVVAGAWTETIEHPAVTCPEGPDEIVPNWSHTIKCPISEVNVVPSDKYTFEVNTDRGRLVTITFTAVGDYVFAQGENYEVSDDGKTAVVQTFLVIPRCPVPNNPEEPETPDNPDSPNNPDNPVVPETPVTETGAPSVEKDCLAGALVTEKFDANGNRVSQSIEHGHPSCPQQSDSGEPFKEEGL